MSITLKNKRTGKAETIKLRGFEVSTWGFSFFADSELEAFKAAYAYRNSKYGVIIEFAEGCGEWMVTVFNECGADRHKL